MQGTMAEYLTLPVGNLHVVPNEVPDQDACFAEPLAAACRITEQQLGLILIADRRVKEWGPLLRPHQFRFLHYPATCNFLSPDPVPGGA